MKRAIAFCFLGFLTSVNGAMSAQSGIVVEGKGVVTGGALCAAGAGLKGFDNDGAAICACLPGFSDCSGNCWDLTSDPLNCGACGNVCDPGLACEAEECRACDFYQQDCAIGGQACYPDVFGNTTICGIVYLENPPGEQGDACTFTNGCAKGFGCVLANDPETPTGLECARLCEVDKTFPPPDDFCAAEVGAGFRCVRKTDLYLDTGLSDLGFCIGPEWFP